MKGEQARLEQKETELKSKEKQIDAKVKEKEEESRERMAAEERKVRKKLKADKDMLEGEKRYWEEEKERVKQTKVFEKVVTLDVGGTKYRTTLSTLTKYPDSMLGVMFSGRHDLPQQEDGSYFIDRDADTFHYILMFLRDHNLCLSVFPTFSVSTLLQLKAAFEYFQLCPDLLNNVIRTCRASKHFTFPVRSYHEQGSSRMKIETEFSGCQLYLSSHTRHDVKVANGRCSESCEGVNFKTAVELTNCNLSGARFVRCSFQASTSFEGCILLGTVFDQVDGLVRNRVHFTPWQVAQAEFEPQLLEALQEAGCIYN